jgi:hypothetical protein
MSDPPNTSEADTNDIQQQLAILQQTLNSVSTSLLQISTPSTPTMTTAQGSAVQIQQQPPPVIQQNVIHDINALHGPTDSSAQQPRHQIGGMQISQNFVQNRDPSPDRQSEISYRDINRAHSRNSFVTYYNEIPSFLQNEKPPTFDGKKFSPPQFLEKLQEYFEQHDIIQDRFRLACAKRSLEKHYEILLNRNSKKSKFYSDFEDMFLEEFWSPIDRLKYRDNIFNEKFRSSSKSESLYSFFRNTLDKVEKYYPEIPFEDFKLKFTAQIPSLIALFVKSSNISNMEALTALIKSVDECDSYELQATPRRERERNRSPNRSAHNDERRRDNQNYNKSRGNWHARSDEQHVNLIHSFDREPQQEYYSHQRSHYNSRGRGRGRYKPYNWNANRQNTNNLIDARLSEIQENITKLINSTVGENENSSQQPRHQMGGTPSVEDID